MFDTHVSFIVRPLRQVLHCWPWTRFLLPVCLFVNAPSFLFGFPHFPFFPFYLFLSSLSCLCPFYLFPSSSKMSLCPRFFSADFASRVFPSWTFEASFSPLVFPACLSCFPLFQRP